MAALRGGHPAKHHMHAETRSSRSSRSSRSNCSPLRLRVSAWDSGWPGRARPPRWWMSAA